MDKLYRHMGSKMRALRRTLRMTQARVAEAAGIEPSFYGHIERGTSVPSLATFLSIAKALDAEPADLLPDSAGYSGTTYRQVIERIVSDVEPGKRDMFVGMVSDMASRLRK